MRARVPRKSLDATRRRRTLGGLLVLTVSCGVVLSAVGLATPANASPYPTWAEVQAAKSNQSAAQKQEAALNSAITSLQARANDTGIAASIAGEAYQNALAAEQQAQSSLDSLKKQQADAAKQAKVSEEQVGQLAAQLSHAGGGQLTVTMLTESNKASDLLYQLGAMANLTERTTSLLQSAREDVNLVSSLRAQASAAQTALNERTATAAAALKHADDLAQTATTALASQQQNESQLIAQIAYLKGTTASVEAKYYAGVAASAAASSAGSTSGGGSGNSSGSGSGGGSGTSSGSGSGGGTGSGGGSGSGSGSASGSGGGGTTPTNPTPPVTSPPVNPPPVTPPPSNGTPAATATAIAYAKAQVGKPYVFDAAGPNAFDCSGLMMASYSAAGVYIGGHGVRLQWNYLGGEGRLVPLSDWQPGDIIFYFDPTANSMYHDAMYIGNGLMIEAPNPAAPVRIVPVRTYQIKPQVGRPVG